MTENKSSDKKLLNLILEGVDDVKGEQVTVLDLRDIDSAVCDYFIICNGTSSTHVNAIVRSIQKTVSKESSEKPWHVEGTENGQWVLMDYVDMVVHVFQKHIREYYDLESLWGDAKIIPVNGK
ncbi:MAG TPA: ribosome silencing factor [Flavobacteriaceae bacterium]|nr:ribosome silencing factor [Flavobacteriaceae bacterium]